MNDPSTTAVNETLDIRDVTGSSWTSARSVTLGLIFGGVFLFLAFQKTSYQGFIETLQTAKLQHIFFGIGLYALYLIARTLRWSILLAERAAIRPFPLLLRATTWGTAANTIFPHSGEFLRTLVVRNPLGASAASILGSIAAERFYDFATVVLLTAITLFFFDDSPLILRTALLAICGMGAAVLAVLLFLSFKVPFIIRVVDIFTKLLPKKYEGLAAGLVDELSMGIRSAFSNRYIVQIGVLSVCQWLCVAGCIFLAISSFGPGNSLWLAFIVLPLTIAGLTLPTAPVYLGTIQVCFLAGLAPFGISNEVAIASSVAYISITTIPVIIVTIVWYLVYVLNRKQAF